MKKFDFQAPSLHSKNSNFPPVAIILFLTFEYFRRFCRWKDPLKEILLVFIAALQQTELDTVPMKAVRQSVWYGWF